MGWISFILWFWFWRKDVLLRTHAAPGSCKFGAHLRVGVGTEGAGRRVRREGALLPLLPSGPVSPLFALALLTPGQYFQ